jgi:hypothetical protein
MWYVARVLENRLLDAAEDMTWFNGERVSVQVAQADSLNQHVTRTEVSLAKVARRPCRIISTSTLAM